MSGSKSAPKTRVVFVGGFRAAADGTVGGQMVACRSLIDSPISDFVEWRLIDSTMRSQPPPGLLRRSLDALARVARLLGQLIFGRVRGLLVFSAFEPSSLAEKGLMCILGRLFGKRVVLSIRSEVRLPARASRLFAWFARRVVRRCHVVICQSRQASEKLIELTRCDPARIEVIGNWIDARSYASATTSGRRDGPAVALFVGWLEPYKGVYELLDAMRILAAEGCAPRLVLCGSGSQRAALESIVQRDGLQRLVEFRGWVAGEQKMAAYAEADLFVLPTYSEGMPNALMEAMACGLPVAATPVGGIPSLIEDGYNGFFVAPRNADALANAMRTLINDPALRRRMGDANRARIEGRHDIATAWPRIAHALGVDAVVEKGLETRG